MPIAKITFRHVRRAAFFLRHEGFASTARRSRIWWQAHRSGVARSIAPAVTARMGATHSGIGTTGAFWQESARKGAFELTAPRTLRQRRKVALIGDLNLPQCRKYRVEQLAEVFAAADTDFAYSHYEDEPRSMDIMQDATHLLFYRLRNSPLVTQYLYEARRLKLPLLYDIDDPLFSVPAYATYGNMAALPSDLQNHFIAEAPTYADVMNMADMVSVSTPTLQEHARQFTNRPVLLRRNFADQITLSTHPLQDRPPDRQTFRVAFASGSHGHEIDFAVIKEDVSRFLAAGRNRKLVILGHFDVSRLPKEIHGQIETHPFSGYTDYLAHLAACDVAIMPLADDLFNRCKSGVRVIDASSVGVASLVGDISDMATLVEDGTSGRVLSKSGDWATALEDIVREPGLARQLGAGARRNLERNWSARLKAPVMDAEMMDWINA